MEEKSRFKLIVYAILSVILFFGLISMVMLSSGKTFYLELVGLLSLLLLSLIGFVGYAKSWGERVLFFVFLFYLLNLVLVWYFIGPLYLILLLLAVIGMLMSFPKKPEKVYKATPIEDPEPHSEVFDVPVEEVKVVEKKTAAKHSPGKLVASKNSNIYHLPKCEWAKKIKRHRRLWFKSKEEAWEKGYRAHNCVE